MQFSSPLIPGTLLRRYQRFLADVRLDDGTEITVHCPNTGAMTGCCTPGWRVWLSRAANSKRKYTHTWELVETKDGHWVGVHPGRANGLVEEAIVQGVIPELRGYPQIRRETRWRQGRVDLALGDEAGNLACLVEVKSVTLLQDPTQGSGAFPDAVTTRGQRQLRDLIEATREGLRAAVVFSVPHQGIQSVRPADEIDPNYAAALREAHAVGVEVLAYRARITPTTLQLDTKLPVMGLDPLSRLP